MKAQVGDELVVKGLHVGNQDRKGAIVEVRGEDGGPPYLVRWSDGHESSFYPSAGTVETTSRCPPASSPGRRNAGARRNLARGAFVRAGPRRVGADNPVTAADLVSCAG